MHLSLLGFPSKILPREKGNEHFYLALNTQEVSAGMWLCDFLSLFSEYITLRKLTLPL